MSLRPATAARTVASLALGRRRVEGVAQKPGGLVVGVDGDYPFLDRPDPIIFGAVLLEELSSPGESRLGLRGRSSALRGRCSPVKTMRTPTPSCRTKPCRMDRS